MTVAVKGVMMAEQWTEENKQRYRVELLKAHLFFMNLGKKKKESDSE